VPAPPIVRPVRELFRWVDDYRETLYLTPEGGSIPLGEDLTKHSYECALYWLKRKPELLTTVGLNGMTVEQSRERGLLRQYKVGFDPLATTLEVWLLARATILLGVGSSVELQEVKRDPSGYLEFPVDHWVEPNGVGRCPMCKTVLPWRNPCFAPGVIRRCPHCVACISLIGPSILVKAGKNTSPGS